MVQVLFPNNDANFQDGSPTHKARSVQTSCEEHEEAFKHLLWLAQSPDLEIIEPLFSFREQTEKQIPSIISQAAIRRVVQYATRDYSELTWVYSKKDTSCVTGKWWPNSTLINVHLSQLFPLFFPSTVHTAKLYSLGWLDKLCIFVDRFLFNSLPCLSVFSTEWFCFVNLFLS